MYRERLQLKLLYSIELSANVIVKALTICNDDNYLKGKDPVDLLRIAEFGIEQMERAGAILASRNDADLDELLPSNTAF